MEKSALDICVLMEEHKRKKPYASRRTWCRTATKTLLVFVNNRKEEFTHVKKRKYVYVNLVEDLTSSGVSEIPFYAEEIKYKLKTLKNAYKSAIDSNNRTGAGPVIAPYMELMDEIYGYDNVPPECSESLARSVGIDRQELPENINSKQLFESLIDVSIPGTDCVPISPFQGLSTLASSPINNNKKCRQELSENIKSKELFKSIIDVSIPGTDCVPISPFQGLSTLASSHLNNNKKCRQELSENIYSKQLFESLIDVSIPGTDYLPISPFQGLSTSASSHLNNNKKCRQELPENINSKQLFESLIDVSIPGTDCFPISPFQGLSTSASSKQQ